MPPPSAENGNILLRMATVRPCVFRRLYGIAQCATLSDGHSNVLAVKLYSAVIAITAEREPAAMPLLVVEHDADEELLLQCRRRVSMKPSL